MSSFSSVVPLASVVWVAASLMPPERVASDDVALARARESALERVEAETKGRSVQLQDHGDVAIGRPDVVWVGGSGHGQTLELGRLVAGEGGVTTLLSVRVQRAGRAEETDFPDDQPWALEVRRRPLAGEELRTLLLTLASIGRVEVVPPPSRPVVENEDGTVEGRGGGGWSSSRDFCAAVGAVGVGAPLEEAFAGYASSYREEAYARPAAAVRLLREASRGEGAVDVAGDESVRAAFAEALRLIRPHLDQSGWWWVRERILVVGGRLAAPAVAPYALEVALGEGGTGASDERSRNRAVTALALVTGEELRFDDSGRPRPVAEIAADYAALLGG